MASAAVSSALEDIVASSYVGFDCKRQPRAPHRDAIHHPRATVSFPPADTTLGQRNIAAGGFGDAHACHPALVASTDTRSDHSPDRAQAPQAWLPVQCDGCRWVAASTREEGTRLTHHTGQTGLGKSTLVNTLFASHLVDSKGRTEQDIAPRATTEIHAKSQGE